VDEEKVKWARILWAGGLLTECPTDSLWRILRTRLCKTWEPR
jgi:hypothetical protein